MHPLSDYSEINSSDNNDIQKFGGNTWARINKSPFLGPFTANPMVKQVFSVPKNISEVVVVDVFYRDTFCNYYVKKVIIIIIPWSNSSLKARAYQPTASLNNTCPLTEVNSHLASLGVTCDQNVVSPNHFLFSRP